jgi:hypothetical protein
LALATAAYLVVTPANAGDTSSRSSERKLTEAAEGNFEVLEQADQYAEARTSPADFVDAGAFSAGYAAYKLLPVVGGSWTEATTKPYDSDAHGYRDPVWSNSGGGAQHVAGRMTSLALDGTTLYAGAADGGVWKKVGNGAWQPLTDDAPTLSTGALLVTSGHTLWVGTGEANTNSDSYAGIGVLRSVNGGTFQRVGGDELNNHTIGRLAYANGYILAATSRGLFRHSATTVTDAWTPVLAAGVGLPGACTQAGGAGNFAFVSDVAVKPGTNGAVVDAVVGWRAGSNCNGFFESTDGGLTFNSVTVNGAINNTDLGRVTIAWSADATKMYAIVQSASMFNHPKTDGGGTLLQGVYSSNTGFSGPWNKIAEWRNLANSGSALKTNSKGYHPGVQAWYNQFLGVDPANANHVFVGLEEVFETNDGGGSWNAAGPYWNFGLPCSDNGLDSCAPTTHPDQHAVAIGNSKVYVGNDGGVYSRGLNASTSFASLNDGLRTLQYYYVGAGHVSGGDALWGGLQDNGESLLSPGSSTMVSPFGGDGGDTYVDPTNGDRAIVEYVGLDMALTTNGGRSDGSPGSNSFREISPACGAFTYTPSPCDPLPRFIAPFEADPLNTSHWYAGGEFLWDNHNKGWDTTCSSASCDWTIAGDSGAGHSITQIGVASGTWYAAWCGPCNSAGFTRGILTNAGGQVHQLNLPVPPGSGRLPNRFIQGVFVDPANASHVYVVFNGFSRRWTNTMDSGEGHVFETMDAGATWTDISGNLPDIPGDDIILVNNHLVLATDVGVLVSGPHGGTWSRLGSGLPNASVNDIQLSSDGTRVIAATHGRGLWTIATPS